MGKKITLELPETFDMEEKELLMLLAAHLYGDGRMSMGRAAAIAGVDKRTLMENLGRGEAAICSMGRAVSAGPPPMIQQPVRDGPLYASSSVRRISVPSVARR